MPFQFLEQWSQDLKALEVQVFRQPNREAVTCKEALELLKQSEDFRSVFIHFLQRPDLFETYFFETPHMTKETVEKQPFEFALIDAPELAKKKPDRRPFMEHFAESFKRNESIAAFPNLGGDGVMVAPCPSCNQGEEDHFSSLAPFVKKANNSQVHAFWSKIGEETLKKTEKNGLSPVWLSTAGQGVSWLHGRIEDRPKYYSFPKYSGGWIPKGNDEDSNQSNL